MVREEDQINRSEHNGDDTIDESFIPYIDVEETVYHLPETHLGYNVDDELVEIKKYSVAGGIFIRYIEDPDVTDKTVARWVKYRKWQEMSR